VYVSAVGLAVVCALACPAWPDDWDGLGFLASVRGFDMAAFAPHPPGYPVYVALLKAVAALGAPPSQAASIVAAASGSVTFLALCHAMPADGDLAPSTLERALIALAVCLTPLSFHAFSGVGSEGPALAFAAVAFAGMVQRSPPRANRAVLVGLAVGLGLGVRLSWAPFYVSLLVLMPRGTRGTSFAAGALACLGWAIPLAAVTGPARLVSLYRTHLSGHLVRWGGTALTEPARVRSLARDVLADGFGAGRDAIGVVVLVCLAATAVAAGSLWVLRTPREARARSIGRAFVLAGPYLAWVVLGQNLRQQPRHALPLVFLLSCAIGWTALVSQKRPAIRMLLAVLAVATLDRAVLDAVARRTIPPPGVQLLAYVRGHARPETSALFTGASGRFLDGSEWQPRTHTAGTLGDMLLAVARLDTLPEKLFVTSEIDRLDESPAPLTLVDTFCRPPRLDRRAPCLQLYALDPKAALQR